MKKVMLRVRISERDVHYAGGLVDGARLMNFFGNVEFKAPVYAGDYLEISGWIDREGNSSRHMQFEAYKVITGAGLKEQPSACNVLVPPQLVARASGTCVVPKELQRGPQPPPGAKEGES
jgi:3-aminobutyryl-CoA ammonia-lyase